jgi:hypothetical protein
VLAKQEIKQMKINFLLKRIELLICNDLLLKLEFVLKLIVEFESRSMLKKKKSLRKLASKLTRTKFVFFYILV